MMLKVTFFVVFLVVLGTYAKDEFQNSLHLFASDVYKHSVNNKQDNLFISPFSAEIVIALAQSGAKDETAKELKTVLHAPTTNNDIQTSFYNLINRLKHDKEYSLHTANKIYLQKDFSIKDAYKAMAITVYQAEIENIDFSKATEAAKTMNQWVEEQTQQKIKDLIDPTSLSGVPAVIVNALYFKANWSTTDFHKYPLTEKPFYKAANNEVKVKFMTNLGASYKIYEDKELKARFLQVPFIANNTHMVFVLPDEIDGLDNLEKQPEKIFKQHNFQDAIVNVELPVFKIESSIDFKEILQKLGVKKAFTVGEADFSDIAGKKGDLAIGGIKQKSYIDCNQDGVEAAAATNLWFYLSGPPRTENNFKANHPFMFYIQVKDFILFVGRVVDPKY